MLENAIATAPSTAHARTLRSSTSHRSTATRLQAEGSADGVKPAVDVHDLTGDRACVVREQEADRAGDWARILRIPPQRGLLAPQLRQALEARYPARRDRAERAGGDEVDADALRAEVAREVPRHRL